MMIVFVYKACLFQDMSISWIDGSKSSLDLKMMNDAARCGTIQGHVWPLKDCSLMLRSVCKKQKGMHHIVISNVI